MPETTLSKDEDFEKFGKAHAFSTNNHYEDRHQPKTPSEMQPFLLSPSQSPNHYLLNTYELNLLPDEHDAFVVQDKNLYLSKNEEGIHYTIITPSGNMVYGTTAIGASLDFTNKDAMMRIKEQILTKALAEDPSPLNMVMYEGIPCVAFTEATPEREEAASHFYPTFVTRFNVPEGSVGLINNNGKRQFVAPGNHLIFEHGVTFLKTESVMNKRFHHGNFHVVTVYPGEMYFVKSIQMGDDDFKLLTPGRHVFELADAIILPLIDPHGLEVKVQLSEDVCRTLFVKVPQGKAGVLEDVRGDLCILPPGVTYVNATSRFHTRISSKTCILELPIKLVRTKDHVLVDVDATVHYRIVSPYHAILQLGMNENRRKRIDPHFAPENIEAKIKSEAISQMKTQINSLITMKPKKDPASKTPASYYDAAFNAKVTTLLNATLNKSGNIRGYIEISKVSIINIKVCDPQVNKALENDMAKAIKQESEARTKYQLAPLQEKILSQNKEKASKQAELERLQSEYTRILDKGQKQAADRQQEIGREIERILIGNPTAKAIYEFDNEQLRAATQCSDSFFHYKPEPVAAPMPVPELK